MCVFETSVLYLVDQDENIGPRNTLGQSQHAWNYCAVIILKNLQPGKTLLAHYWFALIGVSVFWKNIFILFLSVCVLSEGHHYSHSYSSPPHLPLLWQPHLVCGPQGELDPQVPLLWYQGPFQEGRHSICDMLTDVLITNFTRSSEIKSHVQNAN